MKFYVYQLVDPATNIPFYIGKGTKNRMYIHEIRYKKGIVSNNNMSLFRKIEEIKISGNEIIYDKIFESNDEIECYKVEYETINNIGLKKLTNLISESYLITSVSDRVSMALSKSDKFKKSIDNKRTPEIREYYRIINSGINNSRYGKSNTEIHMIAIKNSLLNIPKSNDHKKKISESLKKHKKTKEHVKNISQALRNSKKFHDIVEGDDFRNKQKNLSSDRAKEKITYIFTKDDIIITHKGGLGKMAIKYQISHSKLLDLKMNRILEYKGWKFIEVINNYN